MVWGGEQRGEGGLQLWDKEEFPALKRCQALRAERTGSRPLSPDSSTLGEGQMNDP